MSSTTLIHNSRVVFFFLCAVFLMNLEFPIKIVWKVAFERRKKTSLFREMNSFFEAFTVNVFFLAFSRQPFHICLLFFFFARQIDVRKDLGFSCNLFVRVCLFFNLLLLLCDGLHTLIVHAM